jgi:tRNA(fMet)-specific endonuclease VapC
VKQVLIDIDIVSLFLRNHPSVVENISEYLNEFDRINFSIISYYEILSGLKYRDAKKQLDSFLEFAYYNSILPITRDSVDSSTNIYADLRGKGNLIDDIDILIAGIAISNDLVLITHNVNHFGRINGLDVEDWYR